MATLQSRDAQTVEARRQRVATDIQNISTSVTALEHQGAQHMPERVFVGIWLPVFTGEGNPYKVTLQHWINFAEGPFRAVNVIDDKGEVLFQVPPLIKRETVNPIGEDRRHSIGHVLHSAEQLTNFHPAQGMQYLEAELTKRALIMKVPGNVLDDLKTWNAIFARYGKPALKAVDESGQEVKPSGAAAAASDDLSYDVEL